jgi:hypothetical protein
MLYRHLAGDTGGNDKMKTVSIIGVSSEIRIGYLSNVWKAWSLTSPAPTHPETAEKKYR